MERKLFGYLAVLMFLPLVAPAQQLLMYSSMDVDESQNVAHLWAYTDLDYQSYYYYNTQLWADLWIDDTDIACSYYDYGSGTYAEIEGDCSIPAGSHTLDFWTEHKAEMVYYYEELVYCPDCPGWGDQYGFSLKPSGGVYEDNTYVYPPAYLVASEGRNVYDGIVKRHRLTDCFCPTGESTTFSGWGDGLKSYLSGYVGILSDGLPGIFDGSQVKEYVFFAYPFRYVQPYVHSDGCWHVLSPYLPMLPEKEATWTVGTVYGWYGPYGWSHAYGIDEVGFKTSSAAFYYYKNRMQALGQSCTIGWDQVMEYKCSENDWRFFKQNLIEITIGSSSLSTVRNGVPSTPQIY